jgi:hypothetical protein
LRFVSLISLFVFMSLSHSASHCARSLVFWRNHPTTDITNNPHLSLLRFVNNAMPINTLKQFAHVMQYLHNTSRPTWHSQQQLVFTALINQFFFTTKGNTMKPVSSAILAFSVCALFGFAATPSVSDAGFASVRGARANAEGGITAGSAQAVKSAKGSAASARSVTTAGAGNVKAASGGAFKAANGSKGARASSTTKNADGSGSRTSGFGASGTNGSVQGSGSTTRNADGTVSGSRSASGTTTAGGTGQTSTTYATGSGTSRSTSATSATGTNYQGTTTANRADGVTHTGTCTDASGATVACKK